MKRNILYVHHSGSMGGAPRSLSYLLDKIDRDKYNVSLLTIRKGPSIELFRNKVDKLIINEKMNPFHGSTVSGMSFKLFVKNILYANRTYKEAKREISKIKPEIVHLNSTCLFMVAKAAKKIDKNIKVIAHVREPLLNSIFGDILKYMNHKYVDGYIAIDKYDSETINSKNRELEVIYNFIDFKQYNEDVKSRVLRERFNIEENKIIFLYLARIAPSNGTLEFIEAAKEILSKHNKNYHFIISGYNEKDLSDYNKNVINECKGYENIHLLEFRNDVPDIIASSDIIVSPFTEPHFARAIIESSAMGKVNIGSNIGGVNELILDNKTGLLYDSKEDMINKMIKLAEDKQLRAVLGKNAIEFAKENFDAIVNTKKTFEFYDFIQDKV